MGHYKEELNNRTIPIDTDILLKLCTFKVGDQLRGRKIGELFFKAAFNYCLSNDIKGTYLTLFIDNQPELDGLCQDFGFRSVAYKNSGEIAYFKSFIEPKVSEAGNYSPLEFHVQFYPYFKKGPNVNKFIVPVIPLYHKTLFPDNQSQLSLFHTNESVNNGILKAYICHSKNQKICPGDLLLFYRSHDWHEVTTLGIVESVFRSTDPDEIAATVSKRTVYSYEEINQMSSKEALVILFRQIWHLNKRFDYKKLKKNGIIKNHVETLTQISDQGFTLITSNEL